MSTTVASFTHDDCTLHYTTTGLPTLPPILLIHGWTCDSHDWNWQIPILSQHYFVTAHDLRGHGRSTAPRSAYKPATHAADAAALLAHLGFQKNVIVIAHSMGTLVAGVLAVEYPSLVKALVLIDALPMWQPDAKAAEVLPQLAQVKEAEWPEYAWSLALKPIAAPSSPDWMKMWYERRTKSTPAFVVGECLKAMWDDGSVGREEVGKVYWKGWRCPRLSVYADEKFAEKERGRGVKGLDEVRVLEGYGHWLHQLASEQVNEMVLEWLKKVEGFSS